MPTDSISKVEVGHFECLTQRPMGIGWWIRKLTLVKYRTVVDASFEPLSIVVEVI